MIRLMMRWFRKFCQVPEEKFRIGLFIHTLYIREDCLGFWSKITHIPPSQFNGVPPGLKPGVPCGTESRPASIRGLKAAVLWRRDKPYIKPTIFSNRKNKLYEGTCVIKIHNKDLLSKVLGWIDGVKEYFLTPTPVNRE